MIRIGVIAVAAALLAAWVKSVKPEYSLWITAAAGILLGSFALTKLGDIVTELQLVQKFLSSYGTYFKLLIKMIGIAYVAEFSADLCKDAGANVLASQVELLGKLSVLILCMPVMTSLLETIDYFLGGF